MATYLTILNNVQRRLRENVSTDVETNDYDILLSIFIDDAKRDFEDTYDWERYKEVVSVSVASPNDTADLGSGTSNRTRVLDAWNTSSNNPLYVKNLRGIISNRLADPVTTGSIEGYHWGGGDSSDGTAEVHLFPRASSSETLKFWIYNPPIDLRGQDKDTVYDGPARIIELGAYARALAERGDDGGTNYQLVNQEYKEAISDLLGYEQQRLHGFDWTN